MTTQIKNVLAMAGFFSALTVSAAFAQTAAIPADKMSDSKMSDSKMSGSKMSHHQMMMDKMNNMSAEDKAAMFDGMSAKNKMAAMKMSGHDASKMPASERMSMMGKMTSQEKADMFDKIPMEKKMSMMKGGSMHKDKKMDKMDKM